MPVRRCILRPTRGPSSPPLFRVCSLPSQEGPSAAVWRAAAGAGVAVASGVEGRGTVPASGAAVPDRLAVRADDVTHHLSTDAAQRRG